MEDTVIEQPKLHESYNNIELLTHNDILHRHSYTIKELQNDHATIELVAQKCEKVKENGFIYSGELFSAASFAATASINQKDFILVGSNIDFLNAIKEDGNIIIEANVDISGSVKKSVIVVGKLNDIEFLRGDFSFVKLNEDATHKKG